VAAVLERVTATARAHGMFLPGRTVVVAVSGGPDSVCLLESLVRLRRLFRYRLEVVHVDHRLRRDSAADAAYVGRLAARLGLPFHLREAGSAPATGDSVEAWARAERLAAIAAVAHNVDATRVALGHTMDDQAETVLLNLITGSGLRGLSAIAPVAGPYVNPLIEVRRSQVEAFCRALGLRPRLDPTNRDPRFLRNAVRLQGLPALERVAGRSLTEPLARTADTLREDSDELTRMALEVTDDVVSDVPGGLDVHAVRLLDLPRAVGGRVVTQAIYASGVVSTRADVDAVYDLAAGRPGRRRDLSGGLKARRGREYVHLVPGASPRSSPGERRRREGDGA
jgi:tRNA(Ile)-lysidine synthase